MKIKVTLEESAKNLGCSPEQAKDIWMYGIIIDNGFTKVMSKGEDKFMLTSDRERLSELINELGSEYLNEDYSKSEIADMEAEKVKLLTKKYSLPEAFLLLK